MKINLLLKIIALSTCLFLSWHSLGERAETSPSVASGTPTAGTKFWDRSAQNEGQQNESALSSSHKYKYFTQELTNFPGTNKGKLYDYIDPAAAETEPIDAQLFDKILAFKYLDKTERERIALNRINIFLAQNYKTQTLPGKIYKANAHLPEPFYLSDLKNWTFTAVRKGDINALRAFLDNYNLLNIKDEEGYSLLSYAILHHQHDITELLIKRGINLNEKNKYGASPLVIAARCNNLEAVKVLMQHNCDISHKDQFGNTSNDYAVMNRNQEIQQHLANSKQ